jgi:hydroxylamine dehydrogenase
MKHTPILSSMLLLTGAILLSGCSLNAASSSAAATKQSQCIQCHQKNTPGLVRDHLSGKMGQAGVDCAACHGSEHTNAQDFRKAKLPDAQTCNRCHPQQTQQFLGGKHALGWAAMAGMPITAKQPSAAIQGLKGCGGCHKIGTRDSAGDTLSRYGMGCDACHTRHKFSKTEAQRPRACLPCHQGVGYIQWESWSHSKHGVIYATEGDTGRAPTCQTCHMQKGDHGVITAWGELAVLPVSDDPAWTRDRAAIFKYLHAYDPEGKPTPGLKALFSAKMLRGSQAEWQVQRDTMTRTCTQCHSRSYVKMSLEGSDQLLREADRLVAQGIETVADLYRRGILKPDKGQCAYPNLGVIYETGTPIEQRLYRMLIEERGAVIHGAFHMAPSAVTWEGQAALKRSLLEIQQRAGEMIERAARRR